jgi:hypothetical protein
MDSRSGISWASATQTFTVGATQAYNLFRVVVNSTTNGLGTANFMTILEWTLNGTEESLCVTSDAKVGVGIANPQRALEVAGDLVVSGTISGGAGMGAFRNRIINGDMRIAQRGTSTTGTNPLFCTVDRFTFTGGTGTQTVTQQLLAAPDTPYQLGIRFSSRIAANTPVTQYGIQQSIEGNNIIDMMWGTSFGAPVTLSFWVRSQCTTGSVVSVSIRNSGGVNSYVTSFTINAVNTWQYQVLTIPPPPNGTTWYRDNTTGILLDIGSYLPGYSTASTSTWLTGNYTMSSGATNILANAGNFIELTGVQLEKGSVATPFEQRPFAQELALCQRYFTKLGGTTGLEYIGSGIAASTTQANILCITPVPMRDISATTINVLNVGNIRLLGSLSGAWNAIITTAIIRDSAGTNGITVQATVGSASLTLGYPYFLQNTNSTGGVIQINNEL